MILCVCACADFQTRNEMLRERITPINERKTIFTVHNLFKTNRPPEIHQSVWFDKYRLFNLSSSKQCGIETKKEPNFTWKIPSNPTTTKLTAVLEMFFVFYKPRLAKGQTKVYASCFTFVKVTSTRYDLPVFIPHY